MKKHLTGKRLRLLILNAALTLGALACLISLRHLEGLLDSQKAAERWRGETELPYCQLSCFLPVDEGVGLDDVYAFRVAMLDKLRQAVPDMERQEGFFTDAWSLRAKLKISSDHGRGDAVALAVGGDFFQFHPLRLVSGTYINESDLMHDRVLLDEDLAWLLFGGTDLNGLEVRIDGKPFYVAGVIRREQDFASRAAYSDGMGLLMSYDAYRELAPKAAISCYEVVMADPVKHFAVNLAREKFPIQNGLIVQNTDRFSYGTLMKLFTQFGRRSMQTRGILYPYWENAARYVEDCCALLLWLSQLLALLPVICLLVWLIRRLQHGWVKLRDDVLPVGLENIQEGIRVRRRRRWEKQHRE